MDFCILNENISSPSPTLPLLDMRAITKRFPGVLALSSVDFNIARGEVHALAGENGAGKSTLMKIVSGVYQRDGGEMRFKGQSVNFPTPRAAQDAGVVTIYQELNQIPTLSITENIFLGNMIPRGVLVDWRAMHEQARDLLARVRLNVDPRQALRSLGVGQQQMVEVAKALHHRADLIIMDEPTSALSKREIDNLFTIIHDLKTSGVSIIYISHHLEETFVVSDRVTVLRDGKHVTTQPAADLNVDKLIRLMVGRDLSEQYPKERFQRGREVLRVENLRNDVLKGVSLSAHAGEVIGIAGLIGAGRTELVRAIFGADPIESGTISIDGQRVHLSSPRAAIRHGIGLLTEDRKQQGLILRLNARENMTLAVLDKLTRGVFTSRRHEIDISRRYIDQLAIKTPTTEQLVINLSGGTQQKVVLSKWMATQPKILIFDEPTRGIDVGAKVEIYKLINQLAREGVAILMVSSELPEILGMSDRVLVMREGRIAGELARTDATEQNIMALAAGGHIDSLSPESRGI
jgi:ribose transport system ATP-binding protein